MDARLWGCSATYPNFQWVLLLTVGSAIGVSVLIYFISRSHDVLVRLPCDPRVKECYVDTCVDCDEPESTYFSMYVIPAREVVCTDVHCEGLCTEQGSCREILCNAQETYECTNNHGY